MSDTDDPNFIISPAPGFIYISPENRALVRPALDVIRAPARDAFHLAARLSVFVATTASYDAVQGLNDPEEKWSRDWATYNRICVSLFIELFRTMGGQSRPYAIHVGGVEHQLVAITHNGVIAHVDPTLGLWVELPDGTYGTLLNWHRGEGALRQTSEALCRRMPYRGVHLEKPAEDASDIAFPTGVAAPEAWSMDALRAAFEMAPLSDDAESAPLSQPPLDEECAHMDFGQLLKRLHTMAPTTTAFAVWLNTLIGVTLRPGVPGVGEHDIVDEETAQLLWSGGSAICGARVNLLRYAMNQYGIRTRNAGFLGLPFQGDHSAIEVFTEGAWRFLDPTFGVYMCAPGQPLVPLSLAAAHAAFPQVEIMAPVQPFWTGFPSEADLMLSVAPVQDEVLVWKETGELVAMAQATYFLSEPVAVGLPLRPEVRIAWDIERDGPLHLDLERDDVAQAGSTLDGASLHTLISNIGEYAGVNIAHAIDLMSRRHVEVLLEIDVRGGVAAANLIQVAISPRRYVDHDMHLSFERRTIFDLTREGGTLSCRFHLTPPLTTLRLFVPIGKTVMIRRISISTI
jgi:hypothetical protein